MPTGLFKTLLSFIALLHTRNEGKKAREMCRPNTFILHNDRMLQKQTCSENDLIHLAKQSRTEAGKTRAQAAREMKVSQTSIFQAEEMPEHALLKLRMRIIEAYSPFKVIGPVFLLEKKKCSAIPKLGTSELT
jgi:DNA-binding XRE family transcriptional regulator